MKKFLVKVGIVFGLVVAVHGITVLVFGNGKIDVFYLRFTTPKQRSLIIGNSRAAQGIVPSVLDETLSDLTLEGPLFNYSFTLSTSPYGPYYLAAIKKKLDPSTRNGLFILSVDPWSVSREAHLTDDDTTHYLESRSFPYNMYFVDSSPNIEYLLRNYYKGWGDMIVANTVRTTQAELHPDGWLEITIPMNKARHDVRIKEKVQVYRNQNFYAKTFSLVRLEYLKKTIKFLKRHGQVFLVRIPLDARLAEIEYEYLPEFHKLMEQCSAETDVPYLDYFIDNNLYQTTDGNHLYKESGKIFSKKLAEDIRKYTLAN